MLVLAVVVRVREQAVLAVLHLLVVMVEQMALTRLAQQQTADQVAAALVTVEHQQQAQQASYM